MTRENILTGINLVMTFAVKSVVKENPKVPTMLAESLEIFKYTILVLRDMIQLRHLDPSSTG
jgi:hypothetical protein